MSNIIILAGSERKAGNTDMLVDAFRKGAAKKNKVEIISVRDYSIKPCIGCNSFILKMRVWCLCKGQRTLVM